MCWLRWLIVIWLVSSTVIAQAGWFTPANSMIQLPATLTIPGNLAVGSILWSSNPVVTQLDDELASGEVRARTRGSRSATFGEDVFTTSVEGVGVRYKILFKSRNYPGGINIVATSDTRPEHPYSVGWERGDSYQQRVSVELVKTGPISAGTISSSDISLILMMCPSGGVCWSQMEFVVAGSGSTTLSVGPSCKVSTPAIAVGLGKVSISAFASAGQTSSPTSFSISLSCTGGDVGTSLYPYVTLTDAAHSGNITDTLTLSAQSNATGVGIQILHEADVLKYGPDSSSPENINRWKAGEIKRGMAVFQIPLRARYVRTHSPLQPGVANGQATFTLSWR